ncbi:alpha-ribazole phosphatase [Pelosinus fermentans]|uniref:Alpha-ribazole phosphatase n=1 Tax=Pelosinus fermentans JBW45 TaxID=1192197 RepID=I9DEP8_9FIRM|nr:alpha-ribazole phosphatase [Pelosinus fermentans]AJQ28652.1 alpha-ribazole phosphatase [Pelosinus fermentans JBW45]
MTRVIFVRHGQTSWNQEGKYQGHSDISLNERGIRQGNLVAKRLANEKISAIYSSDLLRAQQTAEAIADYHGLPVITKPEFREINFGIWEGLTYQEIMADWSEILTAMYSKPGEIGPPQGESFQVVKQRVTRSLQECIAKHQEQTIVLVSHGGTMRVLLCAALGIGLDKIWSMRQDSSAINIIEYIDNRAVVSLVNDTWHVKDI